MTLSNATEHSWSDADQAGLQWVKDVGKTAPRLDSLLAWAYRAGASSITFQMGHPAWIKIHGRFCRATEAPIDQVEFGEIVNHLFGAGESARLWGGSVLDSTYAILIDNSTNLRFWMIGTPTRAGGSICLAPSNLPDPRRNAGDRRVGEGSPQ